LTYTADNFQPVKF